MDSQVQEPVQRDLTAYKDPGSRSTAVSVLLCAQIALAVLVVISAVLQHNLAADIKNGAYSTRTAFAELIEYYNLGAYFLNRARLVVAILCDLVILLLVYRFSKNAHTFGFLELKTSPLRAIGWFFIPILNFFVPYIVLKEIWAASRRLDSPAKSASIIGLWWVLFILASVCGYIGWKLTVNVTSAALILDIRILLLIPANVAFFYLKAFLVKAQRESFFWASNQPAV